MQIMVAYCGLQCRTCPIHVATREKNPSKQQTMRVEIARVCREQYGMDVAAQDITDCDGCRSLTGKLFSGCAQCEIRKCARERQLTSCAFCVDYACERLLKHFETDPGARARLETMRSVV